MNGVGFQFMNKTQNQVLKTEAYFIGNSGKEYLLARLNGLSNLKPGNLFKLEIDYISKGLYIPSQTKLQVSYRHEVDIPGFMKIVYLKCKPYKSINQK